MCVCVCVHACVRVLRGGRGGVKENEVKTDTEISDKSNPGDG